jgi:hypothetical protein
MQAEEFVREGRSAQPGLPPPHLLQLVAHREESHLETAEEGDQQAAFRAVVLEELRRTLSPGDRSLLRFLLEQEIAYHKTAWGIFESIRLCGFLLFVLAQVEDVALLWEAKTTSFDTMCGFDTQFLVGAGVAPTLAYLQFIQEEWAQEARTYIEEGQKTGDFDDLERYRHEMQRYFRAGKPFEESSATEHPKPQ